MTVINRLTLATPAEVVADGPDEPIVISVRGDLDASSAAELRATLRSVAGARWVILDLSEVGFVDSAGIGELIGGIRGVHERSGRTVVIARPGPVSGLLDRVGASRLALMLTALPDAGPNVSISPADNDRDVFATPGGSLVTL